MIDYGKISLIPLTPSTPPNHFGQLPGIHGQLYCIDHPGVMRCPGWMPYNGGRVMLKYNPAGYALCDTAMAILMRWRGVYALCGAGVICGTGWPEIGV